MIKMGFSGDLVKIQDNYVVKICQTNQERFLRNITKQKVFKNKYLQSVPITEQGITDTQQNYIKMPLLQCENPLYWFSKTSIENIDLFIGLITQYLNSIILNSEVKEFDYLSWSNKVISLQNLIQDEELKIICNELLKINYSEKFYFGDSHGDFTFGNMFIIQDDQISIDMIDFLDVFVESPMHDFVKIRQDTKHFWTFHLLSDIDKNRVALILNHIDKSMEQMVRENKILNHYYCYFQILNLMRIIPYNTNNDTFKYLKSEIKELSKCLPQ